MADKLEWLEKHLTLIRYLLVEDAVKNENYKVPPADAEIFNKGGNAETVVFHLAEAGNHKCACELLAYIAHRRAAVWWGYRCVNSIIEELKLNPAPERDIDDIAASFKVNVPDFAKIDLPKPDPAQMAQMEATMAKLKGIEAELKAKVDPAAMKRVEALQEVAFQEFKKVHGIHPKELLDKLCGKAVEASKMPFMDMNAPLFQAAAAVREKIQASRKETIEKIKSVLPPKMPEHEKKLRDNALDAVYRWVAAPDAENSQKCLDIGNECPDTPAGMLSLCAFWAYGNLMPMGEQVIASPPGLAANGLSQLLLICALHKGGTRKTKERYEEYFRLGINVFTGKDNWEESLAAGKMPHEEIPSGSAAGAVPPAATVSKPSAAAAKSEGEEVPPVKKESASAAASGIPESPAYKRWKPNGDTE
jgi:hypothetical protein